VRTGPHIAPKVAITAGVRSILRIGAWLSVFVVVVLSVSPPDYRITTALPRPVEHFSIFLIAGVAFGFAYPYRHVVQIVYLVLFAGVVELIQLEVPGRHARVSDFVVSTLGVGVAYLLVTLVRYAHQNEKPMD
jgi:VanZ family protein